ncbi:hypothetical protein UT300003_35240 [Clostridium sardiniense]
MLGIICIIAIGYFMLYFTVQSAVKDGIKESTKSIFEDKFLDEVLEKIKEKDVLDIRCKSKKVLTNTIKECLGKECKIVLDLVYVDDNGSGNIIKGIVRSVDEIWLRIEYINKNNENALKIIKLENITSIEII